MRDETDRLMRLGFLEYDRRRRRLLVVSIAIAIGCLLVIAWGVANADPGHARYRFQCTYDWVPDERDGYFVHRLWHEVHGVEW